MTWPVFETKRLHIRPLQVEDAPEFFEGVQKDREHLSQWLPWVPGHQDEGLSESFIESSVMQLEIGNGGLWGLFLKGGGLMGTIALHWIQWDHRSSSVGYWLFSPFTGQGYASEGLNAVLTYCFEDLDLNRVEASCAIGNVTSLKLLEKCGFHPEGVRRQLEFVQEKFWDHQGFSMLKEDWLRR